MKIFLNNRLRILINLFCYISDVIEHDFSLNYATNSLKFLEKNSETRNPNSN